MSLSGSQLGTLVDVVSDLFSHDELRRLVRIALDEDLYAEFVTPGLSLKETVFQLAEALERRGRLPEFVAAAAKERPRSEELQQLAAASAEGHTFANSSGGAGMPADGKKWRWPALGGLVAIVGIAAAMLIRPDKPPVPLEGDTLSPLGAVTAMAEHLSEYSGSYEYVIPDIEGLLSPDGAAAVRQGVVYVSAPLKDAVNRPVLDISGLSSRGDDPRLSGYLCPINGDGEYQIDDTRRIFDGHAQLAFVGVAPARSRVILVYTVETVPNDMENVNIRATIRSSD